MSPYHQDAQATVWHGDCLDVLATLPDCSVDAVVTDPPYGLEFMGKEWDKFDRKGPASFENLGPDNWQTTDARFVNSTSPYLDKPRFSTMGPKALSAFQAWCELWAAECLRILKPGGHLLAFGGTRTWHRLVCAIEDAGFEIRDSIAWLYGSGFPKSLDVSKAIDRVAGAERDRIPHNGKGLAPGHANISGGNLMGGRLHYGTRDSDNPATEAAQRWQGWGTALKPAHEPICVARKPLAGTVAGNVLTHGTGALNVDGCRIGDEPVTSSGWTGMDARRHAHGTRPSDYGGGNRQPSTHAGRWPANVILDESQAEALDQMSGETRSPTGPVKQGGRKSVSGIMNATGDARDGEGIGYADQGGASRFFYTAKAGSDERITHNGTSHPTVKPLSLMRWLVRLVTPPGGVILEPFAGSGATVEAALLEGFRCIAIERGGPPGTPEAEYLPMIVQRINRRRDPLAYLTAAGDDLGLFTEEPA